MLTAWTIHKNYRCCIHKNKN